MQRNDSNESQTPKLEQMIIVRLEQAVIWKCFHDPISGQNIPSFEGRD